MPFPPPDSPDSPPTERCARYQVATHAGRTPSSPESGARSGPLERFGLFAGDAAGGELLGDGEHVEHEGQPTPAAGAENRLAAAQSIPRDFGAKARWRNGRFRPQTIGNIDRFRLTVHTLSDAGRSSVAAARHPDGRRRRGDVGGSMGRSRRPLLGRNVTRTTSRSGTSGPLKLLPAGRDPGRGHWLLRGSTGGGAADGHAGHLQHGPGRTVYERGVHRPGPRGGRPVLDGRSRTGA